MMDPDATKGTLRNSQMTELQSSKSEYCLIKPFLCDFKGLLTVSSRIVTYLCTSKVPASSLMQTLSHLQLSRHLQHQLTIINLFVSCHIYKRRKSSDSCNPLCLCAVYDFETRYKSTPPTHTHTYTHTPTHAHIHTHYTHTRTRSEKCLFLYLTTHLCSNPPICPFIGKLSFCSSIIFHWTLLTFLMWGLAWVYAYGNEKFGVCDQDECQVQVKHNSFHLAGF